mmetsp:Transcript_157664/g.505580  ORF Transcript_157664/g.505580 Transcript_157664/m.505580 type:complete len:335 (-) Transcript_157664:1622-2626(-)
MHIRPTAATVPSSEFHCSLRQRKYWLGSRTRLNRARLAATTHLRTRRLSGSASGLEDEALRRPEAVEARARGRRVGAHVVEEQPVSTSELGQLHGLCDDVEAVARRAEHGARTEHTSLVVADFATIPQDSWPGHLLVVKEHAIEGAIQPIVEVVPRALGRFRHRDDCRHQCLCSGCKIPPRLRDNPDASVGEELLQQAVDVCGMFGERRTTFLVHARETTTDVQQFEGEALAIRFVENDSRSEQGAPEGAQLGATTSDMKAHANDLHTQLPRAPEKRSTILRRASELVGERALSFAIVRLHTQDQLGRGVHVHKFIKFCRIVEDQPSNANSASE